MEPLHGITVLEKNAPQPYRTLGTKPYQLTAIVYRILLAPKTSAGAVKGNFPIVT